MCAFALCTAIASVAYSLYTLFGWNDNLRSVVFGLNVSLLLMNLQSIFVLGAATAPLAENFAEEVINVYEAFIDEMLGKYCTACMDAEDVVKTQMLSANSQLYGVEWFFVIASVLQVFIIYIFFHRTFVNTNISTF